MEKKKLKIKYQRYGGETTVISLRITRAMLKKLDEVAEKTGRTRNEIMITSLEFALENLEIEE